MSDNHVEVPPQGDAEEMPACKLARYPPKFYMDLIGPYTAVYEAIQSMLFWRRPIHMAVILVLVELSFIFVGVFEIGFLPMVALAMVIYHIWLLVGKKVIAIIPSLFPEIPKGEGSNRIYPLLPFAQRFSHISSTFVDWIVKHAEKVKKHEFGAIIKSLITSVALFLFFSVTGTFWFIFILVHIILLAPGIVMHPQVFPHCQPYIMKFAAAIKCPYCHQHAE